MEKARGLILRTTASRENDLIISILVPDSGKEDFYSKNVRKTNSKRRSKLEVLNLVEFTYTKKKSDKQLSFLGELKLIENFSWIKSNPNISLCLAEILSHLNYGAEDTNYLLQLMQSLPHQMSKPEEMNGLLPVKAINFIILKLINQMGFMPELNVCVRTGEKFEIKDSISLMPDAVGYFKNDFGNKNGDIIRIIKVQNYIINYNTEFSDFVKLDLDEAILKKLLNTTLDWVEVITERKLHSRALVN